MHFKDFTKMGFWNRVWEVTKFTGKVAGGFAVETAIVATGGAALPTYYS